MTDWPFQSSGTNPPVEESSKFLSHSLTLILFTYEVLRGNTDQHVPFNIIHVVFIHFFQEYHKCTVRLETYFQSFVVHERVCSLDMYVFI